MPSATLADEIRPFEVIDSRDLIPGQPLVARLIGRRFDAIVDGIGYAKPYDASFGKAMVKTLSYLLSALGASFGFAEQTELSLFAIAGGGDARRLLARIAGEASAKLSLQLGDVHTFEARLYQFQDARLGVEYFRWRQEEVLARAIDRYCQFILAQSGTELQAAERIITGLGADEKIELLRQNGLEFQATPSWQRRGAAVVLRAPSEVTTEEDRGRLTVDLNLPADAEFAQYLGPIVGLVPDPASVSL